MWCTSKCRLYQTQRGKIIYKLSCAVLLSKQFNTPCSINYSAISTCVCLNMIRTILCPLYPVNYCSFISSFSVMLVVLCVAKTMKNFQHFSYFGSCIFRVKTLTTLWVKILEQLKHMMQLNPRSWSYISDTSYEKPKNTKNVTDQLGLLLSLLQPHVRTQQDESVFSNLKPHMHMITNKQWLPAN